MGMYTGLKVHVKIKEEYIPMIEKIMGANGAEINYDVLWDNLGYDFTDTWAKVWRSSSIPYGSTSTIWNEDDPEWQRFFENGIWKFQTALKNYENEIDLFLEHVLPEITEECYYVESLYEEDRTGDIYDLVDGKFVVIQESSGYDWDDGWWPEDIMGE